MMPTSQQSSKAVNWLLPSAEAFWAFCMVLYASFCMKFIFLPVSFWYSFTDNLLNCYLLCMNCKRKSIGLFGPNIHPSVTHAPCNYRNEIAKNFLRETDRAL